MDSDRIVTGWAGNKFYEWEESTGYLRVDGQQIVRTVALPESAGGEVSEIPLVFDEVEIELAALRYQVKTVQHIQIKVEIGGNAGEPWHNTDDILCIKGSPNIDRLPLYVGISANRKQAHFCDCVDYIKKTTLTKDQVLALAKEFEELAALMEK